MSNYWKKKILPKIKKLIHPKGKKPSADDVIKCFEASKEVYLKELEEKHDELKPKVVEIYKASSNETKNIFKTPCKSTVEGSPEACKNLLVELSKIDIPGTQYLSDEASKHGSTPLFAPIVFILEKIQIFVAEEEAPPVETKREIEISPETKEEAKEPEETKALEPPVAGPSTEATEKPKDEKPIEKQEIPTEKLEEKEDKPLDKLPEKVVEKVEKAEKVPEKEEKASV